jgi:hypothetical protein
VTDQATIRNQEAHDAAEKLATYEWGFTSDIEQEFAPKGLSEVDAFAEVLRKNAPLLSAPGPMETSAPVGQPGLDVGGNAY